MAVLSRTRVCIKNLPPTTTEKDLKEFLIQTASSQDNNLEITDCKVLRNAKGKSRKVAFVGFRREEQAKYVVDNFHRTFLRMSRLSVEPATAKTTEEDDEKKKKNKKDDKTKRTVDSNNESTSTNTTMSKKKQELLRLISGDGKTKFWANDDDDYIAPVTAPVDEQLEQEETSQSSSSDDDDSSSSDSSDDEDEMVKGDMEAAGDKKPLSDLDFLRSKQTEAEDLSEEGDIMQTDEKEETVSEPEGDSSDASDESSSSDGDSSSDSDEEAVNVINRDTPQNETPRERNNEEDKDDDESMEEGQQESSSSTRLFVRNLPFNASEEELDAYFSTIGKVVECHIPVDDQKRSKGFAFVAFASSEDALAARTQLDKMDFQGRLLHILPARAPPATAAVNQKNLTWKQRQELARKEQETKRDGSTTGWSASFVRGDAVVDNLADRLGLRKGDLLGVKDKLSSGDAAVRLALGETQIIEENREYFRGHGVDMDALVSGNAHDKSIERSKVAILVKNLPYDTREEELTKLFHVGQAPVKILLPPSRTIALVEYGHSSDAKRAFKKLAYRRFKHVPIYLEWAPLHAKKSSEPDQGSKSKPPPENDMKEAQESSAADLQEADVAVDAGAVSATIYVKNLNFQTTESTLQEVFEKAVGGVRAVRIPTKASVVRSNDEETKLMSMGYGFVELAPPELAKKAISKLQKKLVDGHEWELSISSKPSQKTAGQQKDPKNRTKLMVRNVPFQATRQELLKLFGSFGSLRKVRLPQKFNGTHRGFAFVEFLTAKEAQAAMTSLSGTHLYGRHLVLEWASEDDNDLDKLRDKAKRDTAGAISSQPKNKKIRFN